MEAFQSITMSLTLESASMKVFISWLFLSSLPWLTTIHKLSGSTHSIIKGVEVANLTIPRELRLNRRVPHKELNPETGILQNRINSIKYEEKKRWNERNNELIENIAMSQERKYRGGWITWRSQWKFIYNPLVMCQLLAIRYFTLLHIE